MKWMRRLRWRGSQAEQAHNEQKDKLRDFRRTMPAETHRTVYSFTLAVEAAMRRRR